MCSTTCPAVEIRSSNSRRKFSASSGGCGAGIAPLHSLVLVLLFQLCSQFVIQIRASASRALGLPPSISARCLRVAPSSDAPGPAPGALWEPAGGHARELGSASWGCREEPACGVVTVWASPRLERNLINCSGAIFILVCSRALWGCRVAHVPVARSTRSSGAEASLRWTRMVHRGVTCGEMRAPCPRGLRGAGSSA